MFEIAVIILLIIIVYGIDEISRKMK